MSWDAYVKQLTDGGVAQAAICGLNGGVWAKSPGFNITDDEVKTLVAGFTNPDHLRASGGHAGGEKYFFLNIQDDNTGLFKKGQAGMVVCKTVQAVVIGVHNDKMQPGQCNVVVSKMGDYLRSVGY